MKQIIIRAFNFAHSQFSELRSVSILSVETLETLAKILHILTSSRLLLKALIRSGLFLLHTNLLKFLIVFLVRVLSRVSRESMS